MADGYDATSTWMGITLTHEHIYYCYGQGINPWLTAMNGGKPVYLSNTDPRNLKKAKADE